jgi:hypothetical protein
MLAENHQDNAKRGRGITARAWSNPNPLDFIERDFVSQSVVELRCPRRFVGDEQPAALENLKLLGVGLWRLVATHEWRLEMSNPPIWALLRGLAGIVEKGSRWCLPFLHRSQIPRVAFANGVASGQC